MMSLRRIFGLMLLFLFFEAVVAVVTTLWWHETSVFLACVSMTALAVVVWLAFALLARLLARQRQSPAVKAPAMATPKAGIAEDSFTQELAALIGEANRRLEAVVLPPGRREPYTVETLPLFLVIGPEGAGKTTAMLNSGLEPRLLAGEAAREGAALPTRLANLWFADNSIFAEVAGRVVMQDPIHWEKALRILWGERKVALWKRILRGDRRRSNLKGVLLVCDTNLFLHAHDLQRLGSIARVLNERLQMVQTIFRKDFPVYTLLSKCDAVPYFSEFFAHLNEAEGKRPLGVTLPFSRVANDSAEHYSEQEGKRLTSFFNRLYQSVADKRMVLLAREDGAGKKALAYEFPRELKKLRGDLVQFLLDTFRPASLEPGARLRGFYLTGKRLVPRVHLATDNSANSAVDYSVAKQPTEATVFFGSAQKAGAGEQSVFARRATATDANIPKWTFLAEVFRQIVLRDPLGRVTATVSTGEQTYRNLAYGCFGAICLVLSLVWVAAWQKNHALLAEVQAAVDSTRSSSMPVGPESVSELESMRPLLFRLEDLHRAGAPISYHWGLYSGEKAEASLHQLYFHRFREVILQPALAAMTTRFLALEPSTPVSDDVYKELKGYRTMTTRGCNPDPALVSATLLPVWASTVTPRPEVAAVAARQIQFYGAELSVADPYGRSIPENGAAVANAQMYLRDLSGPDKILHALLAQVSRQQPAERLTDYAGDYSQVMTGPDEVDGAYSHAGWIAVEDSIHGHKLASSGEPCVMGESSGASSWTADSATDTAVQKIFSDTYMLQWKTYLAAHHILPFSSAVDGAQKLHTLADNNRSPLLALVYMTSMNTDVAVPQTAGERVTDSLRSVAKGTEQTLQQVIQKLDSKKADALPQTAAALPQLAPPSVLGEFQPVRAMVDPQSRDKWLNEKNLGYMKGLEELSEALAVLPVRIDKSSPPDVQALERANAALSNATMALHSLEGLFPNTHERVDVDLKNLLREPLDYAARTIRQLPVVRPVLVASASPAATPAAAPAGPSASDLARPSIEQVNSSELELCSVIAPLQTLYPFDANASEDASVEQLNQVFAPATGALARFSLSPDVSKAYTHQGASWAARPDFPATFSQPFLFTLNNLGQLAEELYGGGGSNPHFDYTLTLDGTGKIPFELDVDGHTIKYTPAKQAIPTKLGWPPITNTPTRLVVKTGFKGGLVLPAQKIGPWSLLHLLQEADDQGGNVFTFRTVQFAHSPVPLMNEKGTAGTIQIRVDSPAGNIFSRGFFAKLRCDGSWAVR